MFLMFFGLFSFVNINTNVVRAASFTTLDDYNGDVVLYRGGDFINVAKGMRILEDDSLMTGEGSYATVKFFDDSVSRLDSLTEMVIKKLSKPTQSIVSSHVEVTVREGNVWSKVVNLLDEDDSSFSVEAGDLYLTTKRAAFNVEVNNEGVEVGVFNDDVELRNGISNVSKLSSGSKVVAKGGEDMEIHEINEDEKNNKWISNNLDNDERYLIAVEEKLVSARLTSLGVNNLKDVSFNSSLREEAKMWLTFDDVKKNKMELDVAEKKFVAAQLKLSDPRITEAERVRVGEIISNFENKVEEFVNLINEVSLTDDDYAKELEGYVEDKVLSQKKDLNLVKRSDPTFEAKNVVERLAKKLKPKEDVEAGDKIVEVGVTVITDKNEVSDSITPAIVVPVRTVLPVINLEDRETQRAAKEFGVSLENDKPLDPLLGN